MQPLGETGLGALDLSPHLCALGVGGRGEGVAGQGRSECGPAMCWELATDKLPLLQLNPRPRLST